VLEGFEGGFAASVGAIAVGNPVREAFFALPAPAVRFAGRHDTLRILVIGGSQGAQRLNTLVPSAIAKLKGEFDIVVRHQSGELGYEKTRAAYDALAVSAEVTRFIDDVAAAYAWADVVICRAGALTVAEVAAAGLAAIFIPLPSAVDDHQTRNAEFLVTRGAAIRLAERGLEADQLAAALRTLLRDRAVLLGMAQKARELARPAATRELGECCLSAAGVAA
jgi:UDP-N-acetylglucosamine--N-acetylmuramyl-(pentapeptide) pyrophosphoryl-undecaprenol N-acetylglucosamine transferase